MATVGRATKPRRVKDRQLATAMFDIGVSIVSWNLTKYTAPSKPLFGGLPSIFLRVFSTGSGLQVPRYQAKEPDRGARSRKDTKKGVGPQ